jgi:hypothetical protein
MKKLRLAENNGKDIHPSRYPNPEVDLNVWNERKDWGGEETCDSTEIVIWGAPDFSLPSSHPYPTEIVTQKNKC